MANERLIIIAMKSITILCRQGRFSMSNSAATTSRSRLAGSTKSEPYLSMRKDAPNSDKQSCKTESSTGLADSRRSKTSTALSCEAIMLRLELSNESETLSAIEWARAGRDTPNVHKNPCRASMIVLGWNASHQAESAIISAS